MNNLFWLSIVPPLLAIGIAIFSKKIIPSLLIGLLVGGFLVSKSFIGAFEVSIEYVIDTLSDKNNLLVLLFLYLFSGLINLTINSGGVKAFSRMVGKKAKTPRNIFAILFLLIPVTFIDCGFRIIGTGSILRPLFLKKNLNKEKLAFALNNTASPVVELVPIATTFVGYNVGIVYQGLVLAGRSDLNAYSIWLHAIPLEFFSIGALIATFLVIYLSPNRSLKDSRQEKGVDSSKMEMEMEMNMEMPEDKEKAPAIKPRILNLVIPLFLVLVLSIFFFRYFGEGSFLASDPNKAMLVALFIAVLLTVTWYSFQNYPIKRITSDIISGGNNIIGVIIILSLAWPLASISQSLGLSDLIRTTIGNNLPSWSIPAMIFVTSCVVTYFIGEGWGATSLIMPFAIPLAVSSGIYIPLVVAAVITGATFGDTTSPIAGMTNMASSITYADHSRYIRYATPYNILVAGISVILFLLFAVIL